jgi:hypothetical protein
MGTLTGTQIINGPNGVREQLLDSAKVTWPDNTLLEALAQAQRTVCFWKPDAYTRREWVPMVQGTNQDLPDDGIALLDVSQNQYTGRRITLVDDELLDETNRFWPVTNIQRDVEHFSADPRNPRRFNVAPPNDGTGEVLILYGAVPPDLTSLSNTIALVDTYEYVLKCLTVAEAYRKNSKKQDLTKSAALIQEARASLGIKSQGQVAVAPKVSVSEGMK